jgi:hypothetical protein
MDKALGAASTAYSTWTSSGSAGGLTTAYLDGNVQFKVTKRSNPTISAWDEAANSGVCTRTNPGVAATNNSILGGTTSGVQNFTISSSSGANAGRFSFNWAASAEL